MGYQIPWNADIKSSRSRKAAFISLPIREQDMYSINRLSCAFAWASLPPAMVCTLSIAFALTFLCGPAINADPAVVARRPAGVRIPKVVRLSGTPYERGLHQGKELRQEISRMVGLWKKDLQNQTNSDPDILLQKFLAKTNFEPAIRKWTPELLDEIRGIAEGSGQTYPTMLAYQLMDELWVFFDKGDAQHCSSLGVIRSGSHPAYIAQNMDLPKFLDGSQVILHIAGESGHPEQFVFTSAGLIAANGMNSRSIAIACNTLMQLNASPEGLPVACIVRGVLAKTSAEEVLTFIKTIKHASGQNYIIGLGDNVYDFEASAGKVAEFRPVPDGSVVYHTNHPLTNDDSKPWHINLINLINPGAKTKSNSEVRLNSLAEHLRIPAADINEPVIKRTLESRDSKDHPICRTLADRGEVFSFGAVVMTLSGKPYFQATMGPPDTNRYLRLEFSDIPGDR
jgi:isopenicillin-N N-acyltransferase like protein